MINDTILTLYFVQLVETAALKHGIRNPETETEMETETDTETETETDTESVKEGSKRSI